ncbi:hypothetical protein QE152_g34433 [Popillia japonica]|uniref:Uncharacterized protein n=1 Tax=Popillia japonica TaxID=7064 RepID=A0AAW1ITF8_POPJA
MQEDFIKFKQELARKHEKRRQLIVEKKKEMMDLRDELIKEKGENERLRRLLKENRSTSDDDNVSSKSQKTDEPSDVNIADIKEENEELRNEVEKLKLMLREKDIIADKNRELRISLAQMQKELQNVNTQIISFEKERIDYQEHVTALKDIIRVTKEMLRVRESQIDELKKKITTIEELLASKEISILSDDLRREYERQLRNIRDLRILYEDRQRIDKREKQNLQTQIEELKKTIEDEQKKNGELTERVTELEEDNSNKYDKIVNLDSNLGLAKAECKEMHAEMEVINQLFSQILISFNNDQDVDLDNMIKILEENHDLLTNIVVNDESNQTSALPKVLLNLVNQVNENRRDNKDVSLASGEEEASTIQAEHVEKVEKTEKIDKLEVIKEEDESQLAATHQLNSPEEIVENLPKVWRVLIELLSHQTPPNNEITEKKGENDNHCYKSVETPTGLRKVLSVSKTFIRLKSLILEKKSLEKEMMRLKQLNTHLEGRLSDQEKRLVLVSNELSKTWNFVGKMQKQHQQLHTQEKILRYELAQKRKLLTELKEELEYCRQKWLQARKQNSSTEEQWKQLRSEFASRKTSITDDINNSVESGYSDDKSSSDDEEDASFGGKKQKTEEAAPKRLEELNAKEENERVTNLAPPNQEIQTDSPAQGESNIAGCIERVSNDETDANSSDTLKKDDELTDTTQETSQQNSSSVDICHKTDVDVIQQVETSSQDTQDEEATSQTVPGVPNTLTQDNLIEIATSSNASVPVENILPTNLLDQAASSSSSLDAPGTSHKNPVEAAEEFAARREERMKKLEEQCKDLYFSMAKNSLRGLVMSNKLDNLHEIYGEQSQNTTVEQIDDADEINEQTEECQPNPDITDSPDVKENQE